MEASKTTSSAVATPPTGSGDTRLISQSYSLFTRLNYGIRVWAFKLLVNTVLPIWRILSPSKFKPIAPTYTKRYPIRPTLESRIYLPKSYKSGTKLPLYLNIHGGGFTIGDPALDDHFCRPFADEFGYCVVSLDYRLAPLHPFPTPVYDCAELAHAVLTDETLPIDHDRIALGGFSAGGNLSLAIAQFPKIGSKIKALVPIYPAVDFTRKYRTEYLVTKDGKEDVLKHTSKLFNWAYVSPGTNLTDPLLSCVYATRDKLPQKMYFVGAEYDCLCNEASAMAKQLAGVGDDVSESAWNHGGIRWEMVPDRQHGFTHMELKGQEEVERLKVCHDLYKRIANWLQEDVFKE